MTLPAAGLVVLDGVKAFLDDARLNDDQRVWGIFFLEVIALQEHLNNSPSRLS